MNTDYEGVLADLFEVNQSFMLAKNKLDADQREAIRIVQRRCGEIGHIIRGGDGLLYDRRHCAICRWCPP